MRMRAPMFVRIVLARTLQASDVVVVRVREEHSLHLGCRTAEERPLEVFHILRGTTLSGVDEDTLEALSDEVGAGTVERPHARIERHHSDDTFAQLRYRSVFSLAEVVSSIHRAVALAVVVAGIGDWICSGGIPTSVSSLLSLLLLHPLLCGVASPIEVISRAREEFAAAVRTSAPTAASAPVPARLTSQRRLTHTLFVALDAVHSSLSRRTTTGRGPYSPAGVARRRRRCSILTHHAARSLSLSLSLSLCVHDRVDLSLRWTTHTHTHTQRCCLFALFSHRSLISMFHLDTPRPLYFFS